jgi:hypothetical protein
MLMKKVNLRREVGKRKGDKRLTVTMARPVFLPRHGFPQVENGGHGPSSRRGPTLRIVANDLFQSTPHSKAFGLVKQRTWNLNPNPYHEEELPEVY